MSETPSEQKLLRVASNTLSFSLCQDDAILLDVAGQPSLYICPQPTPNAQLIAIALLYSLEPTEKLSLKVTFSDCEASTLACKESQIFTKIKAQSVNNDGDCVTIKYEDISPTTLVKLSLFFLNITTADYLSSVPFPSPANVQSPYFDKVLELLYTANEDGTRADSLSALLSMSKTLLSHSPRLSLFSGYSLISMDRLVVQSLSVASVPYLDLTYRNKDREDNYFLSRCDTIADFMTKSNKSNAGISMMSCVNKAEFDELGEKWRSQIMDENGFGSIKLQDKSNVNRDKTWGELQLKSQNEVYDYSCFNGIRSSVLRVCPKKVARKITSTQLKKLTADWKAMLMLTTPDDFVYDLSEHPLVLKLRARMDPNNWKHKKYDARFAEFKTKINTTLVCEFIRQYATPRQETNSKNKENRDNLMSYSDDCIERMCSALHEEIDSLFPDFEENALAVEVHREPPTKKPNHRKPARSDIQCPITFVDTKVVPFLFLEIMFNDFCVQLRTLSLNRAQCFNGYASLHIRCFMKAGCGLRVEVCDD